MTTSSLHTDQTYRLLFVDDEPCVLSGLGRILRGQVNWDISYISDPLEALARYKDQPFDCVISDMMMPVLDGISLIAAMRACADTASFALLTGSSDMQIAQDAINTARVDRFFMKPCQADTLINALTDLLTQRQARQRSASHALSQSLLDHMAVGVVLVDQAGKVVHANRHARSIIAEGDGLSIHQDGSCRAHHSDQSQLLAQAIDQASAGQSAHVALIRNQGLRRPLSITLTPLHEDMKAGEQAGYVALFLSDPERVSSPDAETIRALFSLSRAESRLAHALANGLSVDEAATHSGIALSTARSYLKQIFQKTETTRQAELVSLVLQASPRLQSPETRLTA